MRVESEDKWVRGVVNDELELELEAVQAMYGDCSHVWWTSEGWRAVSIQIEQELLEQVKGMLGTVGEEDFTVEMNIRFPPSFPRGLPVFNLSGGQVVLPKQQEQDLYLEFVELKWRDEPTLLEAIQLVRDNVVVALVKICCSDMQSTCSYLHEKGKAFSVKLGEYFNFYDYEFCSLSDKYRAEIVEYIETHCDRAAAHSFFGRVSQEKSHENEVETSRIRLPFVDLPKVLLDVQETFAVTGIEKIMRQDIFEAFVASVEKAARLSYDPRITDMDEWFQSEAVSNMCEIMYHGTSETHAASIVRHGLIPGGSKGVEIRNGAAYGNGIYMGKGADVSSSYGTSIIIAMVLKKSLVYDTGHFCVVGESTHILPLYMLKMEESGGREKQRLVATQAGEIYSVESRPTSKRDEMSELTHEMKQSAKRAAYENAAFYIDTRRFKVLDVADYDDDDDDLSYEQKQIFQQGSRVLCGEEWDFDHADYYKYSNNWQDRSYLDWKDRLSSSHGLDSSAYSLGDGTLQKYRFSQRCFISE